MPESRPHRNGSRSLPSRETIARNSAGYRICESIGTQLDPVGHDENVQWVLESETGIEALRFAKARHCQKLSEYQPLDEKTMHGSIVHRPVEGEPDLHINLSSFVGERPIETTIACYRSKPLGSKAYEELSDIGTRNTVSLVAAAQMSVSGVSHVFHIEGGRTSRPKGVEVIDRTVVSRSDHR
jgi:hypothetical protein